MITKEHLRTFSCTGNGDKEMVVNASMVFDADFQGVQGHSPGNPVLPATIQLGSIRFLCEEAVGVPMMPVAARRVKFKSVVMPDDALIINMTLKPGTDGFKVSFTLSSGESLISSGSMSFAARATG